MGGMKASDTPLRKCSGCLAGFPIAELAQFKIGRRRFAYCPACSRRLHAEADLRGTRYFDLVREKLTHKRKT